jgi:hypothetical protein
VVQLGLTRLGAADWKGKTLLDARLVVYGVAEAHSAKKAALDVQDVKAELDEDGTWSSFSAFLSLWSSPLCLQSH